MGQYISSPTTPGDTVSTLRARAISAGDQRRSYSEQSQAAYRSGRGQEAKRLSELAKAQWAEAERLNALAAELAFAQNNPTYPPTLSVAAAAGAAGGQSQEGGRRRGFLASWLSWGRSQQVVVGLERLDLHGLYVAEALMRVEAHLKACKEHGVLTTVVITGRGNHSVDGMPKIKPSVEKWLKEREGQYRVSKTGNNEGAVLVELVKEDVETTGLVASVMSMFGW